MTSLFKSHVVRSIGPSIDKPEDAGAVNAARLAVVLQTAFRQDGDVLYPLLARILDAHMRSRHEDAAANGGIRDSLDEIQLMISMEIESEGLLPPSESASRLQHGSYAGTCAVAGWR